MHPTPSEQLQVIRHLIERAQADPDRSAESDGLLADAAGLLRRLERSWPKRMPFLVDDNERAIQLLAELLPDLGPLAVEISTAVTRPPANGEEPAHDRNIELQDLLARAVHVLPDGPDGDRGRARIAEHLRHRLAADPSLNRHPAERPPISP